MKNSNMSIALGDEHRKNHADMREKCPNVHPKFIDEDVMKLFRKIYATDFELFGYDNDINV